MDDMYDPFARFDKSNQIDPTAIIHDCVVMGKNNKIGPYTVIGSNGEIRGAKEFHGKVLIGDNNVISELVTIQRPQEEGQVTEVGNNNIIMAHSHLGHDAKVCNDCEICTGTIIGGYAKLEDGVRIKIGSTARNRITIGEGAVCGMGSVIVKDVPKGKVVVGNPAKELRK